ncbi:hypothetical protein [Hanstruepera ponticola]|uniref:hypothetical protein n=1 Tax=Hanstruepera ponticola TaxID=2042995 RepID=UPI000CF154D1|nr:hypothetical protein [Hanstruepera ponticola]
MKQILTTILVLVSLFTFSQSDSLQFPQDFYGIYKGDLHITNARGKQTIQMEFHLNSTDTVGKYQYMLVYIMDGNRQERHYNLLEKNVENGEYMVDENNGIVLDAKLIDNTIFSMFEVQGSILTTTERFYKDSMDFEITFANKSQQTKSGTEGEDATEVISYPISVLQKAHLIKQE